MIYLNLGSNLGDRRANINRAVMMIERRFACRAKRSSFFESAPWGFDSPNRFVNLGIAFEAEIEPLALLDALQEIERAISTVSHRDSNGGYADRLIDIDIIEIDDMVFNHPRLIIPHPLAAQRDFVSVPLAELKGQR